MNKKYSDEEKVFLTIDEAKDIANIVDNQIHCFMNPSFGLLGADWSEESFINLLNKAATIEVGGSQCREMKHAIAVIENKEVYFFEHNEEKLKELLKQKGVDDE